jgi:hypothetical protein
MVGEACRFCHDFPCTAITRHVRIVAGGADWQQICLVKLAILLE